MDYQRALVSVLNGKAVLFAGAGFALGATSIRGSDFPTGARLAAQLCDAAKVPQTADLKMAANWFLKKRRPDELISILTDTFVAKQISEHQEVIASAPWKAIYTTNYDDVIEMGAKARGKNLQSATLADFPQAHRNSDAAVVHINGYIHRLQESTLFADFKLTNTSYLTSQFRESEWCDLFLHQIRSAQAIFFVGYSLYDIDIQEIFFADKSLREKTFFIQRDSMSEEELFLSDLTDFGTIVPIGTAKFAEDLGSVDPSAVDTDTSLVLISFEEMLLPKVALKTTAEDVFSLLLRGQVSSDLISQQVLNGSTNEYVFDRDGLKLISEPISNYVVVGDLGNGKTTLTRHLSAELIKHGYRCFWINDESYDCQEEIDELVRLVEPCVIVFDNYTKKMDLVAYANMKRRSDTKLILSARTLLHKNAQEDLYYRSIRIDIGATCEIDCNKLSGDELLNLVDYFAKYGLWGERAGERDHRKIQYVRTVCNTELHGVLLDLLNSPEIQSRFSLLFDELKRSTSTTKTLVAALALNLLTITNPSAHTIAAITDSGTIFTPAFKSNPTFKQFFNSESDVFTSKSVALAEFCMKNFPDPILLVNCLVEICRHTRAKAATEKRLDLSRFYWDLYRDMASFSNVKRMFPEQGKRELLIKFYEGLRTIELERANPLFWLQYAMARMNQPQAGDLEQASAYLKTAIALARTKKGFTTVDIETQQARLYIEHALHTAPTASDAYEFFVQANSRLERITKEEIYKSEPYRPMHNYLQLYSKFGSGFDEAQCRGMHDSFVYIMGNIKRLPARVADEKVIITARKILQELIYKLEGRLAKYKS